MNKTQGWTIVTGIFLILSIIFYSVVVFVFHPMKVENCKDILGVHYETATEDIADCIRFRNYPFWNFYFIWIMIWLVISIFYWVIVSMGMTS